MIDPLGQVRLQMVRPPDRMVLDRLRRWARSILLALRTPVLLLLGIFRHRERRPPVPARVTRLLVLRADRIGDMALTTPALADLRSYFRKAEITVLAPAAPLELLRQHPDVDHLVPLPGARLPEELVGRFDLVIDFTPDEDLRGALLARATRARLRVGFRAAGRQACFSLRGPRADARRHIVDLNRALLDSLGVPAKALHPALYVSAEERGAAQTRLSALGAAAPRVAVHPGGYFPSQRWSPESYAALIATLTERTGAACIVLSGPGERVLADRINAATPDALVTGEVTVREMMALISTCDLFVGNNSGPLHVAAALGVPTVSIMGPSDPLRFAPRGPADRVVRKDLPCSPCQRARCWHHTCLRAIEPEEVCRQAEAALQARLPREEAL
jgi:lipopolysaccharide heptosyltransferase II